VSTKYLDKALAVAPLPRGGMGLASKFHMDPSPVAGPGRAGALHCPPNCSTLD
jgi:hypothetical protein